MFGFPHGLKTAALAGLGALAITIAAASPASAHGRSFVRCNHYGNHCVRVVCDRDGDRCRRVAYYNRGHDRHYRQNRNRVRVCNRYGRNCHWVRRDRVRDRHYRPIRGGVFVRLDFHP